MATDDKLSPEQAFAQWLEGEGDSDAIAQDKQWQARADMARTLAHHAQTSEQQTVPSWDRDSTFVSEKQSWWQWQGLPALSMAMSVMAICLVLFKVELVVQDEGIMLSFAGSASKSQQQQLEQLLTSKLQAFAQEQQLVLANYKTDIHEQQQQSNLQLASYIMGASRQERQEDINDFIRFFNEQRKDEQLDQQIKFQQLEHAIKQQRTTQTISTETLGKKQQPAVPENWLTEE